MRFQNKFLFIAPFALALSASASPAQGPANAAKTFTDAPPHGFFVSIDGMQPKILEALIAHGDLNADHGLGWLYRNGFVVDRATPIASLTAASHFSTITCNPPSRHGIVANSFLKGSAVVSGYTTPFEKEPLWRAAARQGKKVLALAYVGADASTPERTADYSLAYPSDSLIAPAPTVDLDLTALPDAAAWTIPTSITQTLSATTALKETTINIVLNPKTAETVVVNALIGVTAGQPTQIWLDTDKDLSNGLLGTLGGGDAIEKRVDAIFTEANDTSTMKGHKRRAFFRELPATDETKLSIYVSKASYNNAYPDSFRQALDDADMIWPDYGINGAAAAKITVAQKVEGQTMIDRFLADVAQKFSPELGVDITLFYNPIIDTLGHSYQSKLPDPFDPTAADEITQAFVTGFKTVDANISKLLSSYKPNDVVALMGDHGMDAIKKTVNVGAILPADHTSKIAVVSSGAMILVYPTPTTGPATEEQLRLADEVGANLSQALAATAWQTTAVAGKAYHRPDFAVPGTQADFHGEWQYGEAMWAFTSASGYWYVYKPLDPTVFADPPALGMHGHDLSVPTMQTALLIKAPNVANGHLASGTLLDAVPTFSKLLGIDPPADCQGHVIDFPVNAKRSAKR